MNRYRIHIENYKTIDEMEISLDPGVEGFVGNNAQGKTNILTAIQDLTSSHNDPARIRDGEKRSVLRLDITDEEGNLVASISRIQTKTDCRLEAKGLPIGRTPAAYLASLLDSQMVNPLHLVSDDPVKYLKKHLPAELKPEDIPEGFDVTACELPDIKNGFTLSELIATHVAVIRKDRAHTIKLKEAILSDLRESIPKDVEKCQWNESDVRHEILKIQESLSKIEYQHERRNEIVNEICKEEIMINNASNKLNQIEMESAILRSEIRQRTQALGESKTKKESIKIPDETELTAKMIDRESKLKEIENHKKLVEASERVKAQEEDLEKRQAEHKGLDSVYKHFAYVVPKDLIARAGIPIEGIEFREGTLFVKDRRIDLLSETERAIVATQLAVALAKNKGHLCISLDGIEIMDADHRKVWLDIASNSGIKVLYTRQGKPEEPHEFLVIDGKIKNEKQV